MCVRCVASVWCEDCEERVASVCSSPSHSPQTGRSVPRGLRRRSATRTTETARRRERTVCVVYELCEVCVGECVMYTPVGTRREAVRIVCARCMATPARSSPLVQSAHSSATASTTSADQ